MLYPLNYGGDVPACDAPWNVAAWAIVALAVGLPNHWSPVMAIFVGFAAALAVFLVSSIVLVERDDGRGDDQAHNEARHNHD